MKVLEPVENCTRKTEKSDFVRYFGHGRTMDGKVFWENTPDTTWNTYLGYNSLIAGMEKGLIGACAGEKRLIKIPPSWGYGERGSGSGIVKQFSKFEKLQYTLENLKAIVKIWNNILNRLN